MARPKLLYLMAVRDYSQWKLASVVSKRLRATIRLIAIEERCIELGAGAFPAQVLLAMKLLSDYREAGRKKYYRKAPGRYQRDHFEMRSVIAPEDLITRCGHPATDEVCIAMLEPSELENPETNVVEDVFCSPFCAKPRRVIHHLVYQPEPGAPLR